LSCLHRSKAALIAASSFIAMGCTTAPTPPDKTVASIDVFPKTARMWTVGDSVTFTAAITTVAGTAGAGIPVTWVARDNTLLKVVNGVVTSLRKGGSTYVVATAGAKSDSAPTHVLTTPGGTAAKTALTLGQALTGIRAQGVGAPTLRHTLLSKLAAHSSLCPASP